MNMRIAANLSFLAGALEARPLPKVRGFKPRLPEGSAQNLMLTQRRFHHENQVCSIRRFYGAVQGMRT